MPEDSVVTQKQVTVCMEEDGTMVMSSVDMKRWRRKAANKLCVEKTKTAVKNLELYFYYLKKACCHHCHVVDAPTVEPQLPPVEHSGFDCQHS